MFTPSLTLPSRGWSEVRHDQEDHGNVQGSEGDSII
jgi:hypothetical protein